MKFSLLLFVLGLKLKGAAWTSARFRKLLGRKDFALVIRTEEGDRARTFTVREGRLRSRAGRDPEADTELVWSDPGTAVRIMLSTNELDSFSAIGRSELRILGNFEYALWFMDLAK